MNRNTESQHEISPRKDDEGQILDLRGMNLTDDEAGKSFWEEPAASYVSKSLQTCITFRSGPCRHIAVVWAQGNCPNIGESIWDPSKRCGRRDWPSNERKFFCPSSTSIVRWQERRRSRSPRGGLNTRRISSVPWQDLTTCLMCENYAGVSFLQISPFFSEALCALGRYPYLDGEWFGWRGWHWNQTKKGHKSAEFWGPLEYLKFFVDTCWYFHLVNCICRSYQSPSHLLQSLTLVTECHWLESFWDFREIRRHKVFDTQEAPTRRVGSGRWYLWVGQFDGSLGSQTRPLT